VHASIAAAETPLYIGELIPFDTDEESGKVSYQIALEHDYVDKPFATFPRQGRLELPDTRLFVARFVLYPT
jgi:hypothetical protein